MRPAYGFACDGSLHGWATDLSQDLWHYWQAISAGYTEWAMSGQGLWMLACGVGELIATIVLLTVAVRLLGSKPLRPFRPSQPQVAVSN